MQGARDITGAGCKYDFTWLHTLEPGYSVFAQWEDTKQVYNSRLTDVDAWMQTLCIAKLDVKTW